MDRLWGAVRFFIGRWRGILMTFILIVGVIIGLSLYAGVRPLLSALGNFNHSLLPVAIALILFDYTIRYYRWEALLEIISGGKKSRWLNILVFFGGTTLIFTPGRVGEVVKSVYARDAFRLPIARTMPIILSERLGDTLVMLFLAAFGVIAYKGYFLWATLLLLGLTVVTIMGLRSPLLINWILSIMRYFPYSKRTITGVQDFHSSSRELFSPRPFFLSLSLGMVAWLTESVTFFLILIGVGLPVSWSLLLKTISIFTLSSLLGSLSLLPGGIGATEGSLVALTHVFIGLERDLAVLSTLLIRSLILGVALLLGLGALGVMRLAKYSRP